MAHELEQVRLADGRLAYEALYANDPAWHKLGQVWKPGEGVAPCSAEIEEQLPSIFFQVDSRPVKNEHGKEIPGWKALTRMDTGDTLHMVSDQYTPIQNREGFEFLDSLQQDNIIRYESAFVLQGGKSVVLLARMPSYDEIVPGDVSFRYIMCKLQHGGGATILTPTSVRAVCANTVHMALSSSNHTISIRHSKNKKGQLDHAKKVLSQFDKQFTLFTDNSRKLLKGFTEKQAKEYINELFPAPVLSPTPHTDEIKKYHRDVRKHKKTLDDLRSHYKNPGQQVPGVKDTWYALFNSVTEYIDHSRPSKVSKDPRKALESRYNRLIESSGVGAKVKRQALELAMDMAV